MLPVVSSTLPRGKEAHDTTCSPKFGIEALPPPAALPALAGPDTDRPVWRIDTLDSVDRDQFLPMFARAPGFLGARVPACNVKAMNYGATIPSIPSIPSIGQCGSSGPWSHSPVTHQTSAELGFTRYAYLFVYHVGTHRGCRGYWQRVGDSGYKVPTSYLHNVVVQRLPTGIPELTPSLSPSSRICVLPLSLVPEVRMCEVTYLILKARRLSHTSTLNIPSYLSSCRQKNM